MKLIYSARISGELIAIFNYLVKQGADRATAEAFVNTLRQQCKKLSQLPGTMGRSRDELKPGIRSFSYRGYIIFFRYHASAFEVIDILEGHRDLDSHFNH